MQPQKDWRQASSKQKLSKPDKKRGCGCGLLVLGGLGLMYFAPGMFGELMESEFAFLAGRMPLLTGVAIAVMLVGGAMFLLPGKALREQKRENARLWNTPLSQTSEWDRRIRTQIEAQEQRSRRFRNINIAVFIGGICFSILMFFLPSVAGEVGEDLDGSRAAISCFLFTLMVMGVLFLVGNFPAMNAGRNRITREQYKQQIVLPMLQAAFGQVAQYPPESFDEKLLRTGGLVGGMTKCKADDYLSGEYRGVRFYQADLTTYQLQKKQGYTDRDGEWHPGTEVEVVAFKGRWLYVESRKYLPSGFYVWSKGFPDRGAKNAAIKKGMKPLPLENQNFNSLFDVYVFDEHDAFLFITPSLMERLTALLHTAEGDKAQQGVALMCAQNQVQLAISGVPDAFEPPLFVQQMGEALAREKTAAEIAVITDTIDSIHVNLV